MAYVQHDGKRESFVAASNINPLIPVKADTVANQVVPLATNNVRPLGLVDATALQGAAVTVYGQDNTVKCVAVASMGAGAEVGVGSTNGNVGLITYASGTLKWALGVTRTAAGAGETISVYVNPRQLGDLA